MKILWSKKADAILQEGVFLGENGIQNWALTKSQSVVAIEKLFLARIAVLGGDVCSDITGRIYPNGDSWYCNRRPGEADEDFLLRSISKAREYIHNYPSHMNETVYFNIVPDD